MFVIPMPLKRICLWSIIFLGGFIDATFAQNWGQVPFVSSTMGINSGRLCVGEGTRGDIGCPTYAPTINSAGLLTAGNVSSTGNISANAFIGDGRFLTGISTATNRISTTGVASGATLAAVEANMGTVSFTLGGTAGAAYLHPTLGLVASGVSTTGGISGTTGYFADNVTVSGSVKVGGAADGDCDGTKNGTFRIDPATGRLQMCRL